MELLNKLQDWYRSHCDGNWEHSYGVKIDTLDNPGWSVSIDLAETLLENVDFQKIASGDSEDRNSFWINCIKKDGVFLAKGSSESLEKIISIFLEWAAANTDTTPWDSAVEKMIEQCHILYDINSLRQLFREINDIPTEHPRKKELIETFNFKWNWLIKNHYFE